MDHSGSQSIEHLIEQIKIAKRLSDAHEQKCYMLCFAGVVIALDILSQVFVHQNRGNYTFEKYGETDERFNNFKKEIINSSSFKEVCKIYPGLIFQNGLKGLGFSSENTEINETYKLRNSLLHRFSTKDAKNINPNRSRSGRITEDNDVHLPEALRFIEDKYNGFVASIGKESLCEIVDELYFSETS
ncbi:MAG: hypothetical protein AB1439_06465 [candidate division FCPU426 bacterium]